MCSSIYSVSVIACGKVKVHIYQAPLACQRTCLPSHGPENKGAALPPWITRTGRWLIIGGSAGGGSGRASTVIKTHINLRPRCMNGAALHARVRQNNKKTAGSSNEPGGAWTCQPQPPGTAELPAAGLWLAGPVQLWSVGRDIGISCGAQTRQLHEPIPHTNPPYRPVSLTLLRERILFQWGPLFFIKFRNVTSFINVELTLDSALIQNDGPGKKQSRWDCAGMYVYLRQRQKGLDFIGLC